MRHREAQLEQKAARREAAKEREQSPDISKLPGGGDIMGGDDSFAAAQARLDSAFAVSKSLLDLSPGSIISAGSLHAADTQITSESQINCQMTSTSGSDNCYSYA